MKTPSPARFATPRGRLRLASVVILVVGLLAAVIVDVTAAGAAADEGAGYRIVGGQVQPVPLDEASRELQQIERLGGKAAVQTVKFNRWLASLWHGRRLAYTIGALCALFAAACHWFAGLMDEE